MTKEAVYLYDRKLLQCPRCKFDATHAILHRERKDNVLKMCGMCRYFWEEVTEEKKDDDDRVTKVRIN